MPTKSSPYIDNTGILVIPGECPDDSLKWWKKNGRPVTEILTELGAPRWVWERYSDQPYPEKLHSANHEAPKQ